MAIEEVGPMRLRWFVSLAILFPFRMNSVDLAVSARVATVTITPGVVTILHLRPEFESTIRMPEEVTSIILGSPDEFKAEHNEGEPDYVYVKPITKVPAQSNLLIGTKSGQVVSLELISTGEGAPNGAQPVDFLIEYHARRSLLIASDPEPFSTGDTDKKEPRVAAADPATAALDEALQQQAKINAPIWAKWDGRQIETSIGDVRQWANETSVAYSVYNDSDRAVEILPPQIQISGRRAGRKKEKPDRKTISDPLEIRDYRLSAARLEPGGRADGVVEFDRPNFKESTEQLFLQIAQADQVDHPVLILLAFTPPIAGSRK
jgi:hypothetical protein